jgi:hypothetical protein
MWYNSEYGNGRHEKGPKGMRAGLHVSVSTYFVVWLDIKLDFLACKGADSTRSEQISMLHHSLCRSVRT